MILRETEVDGCYVIDVEPLEDERGFFARTFCADEFTSRGLNPCVAQSSVSYNAPAGVLRGLHYQAAPHEEAKLVRCTRGRVFDVAVDLRATSRTYGLWTGVEMSADNHRALYIPEGCAHGFLTLEAASELFYQISTPYRPETSRGVRWDDPSLAITWPAVPKLVSARDRGLPLLESAEDR
ncbi:MAG: dTDP-4-dehydrorhamnose 3,5-epimerase [Actinomycetota bacterium]|nr:dTDP-4-dehydrorhamnose 3,5-epimerase [Actinomycetota bacterium]